MSQQHILSLMERAHNANVARLKQLASDADKASQKWFTDPDKYHYYAGRRDAYYRAIDVLEGKG